MRAPLLGAFVEPPLTGATCASGTPEMTPQNQAQESHGQEVVGTAPGTMPRQRKARYGESARTPSGEAPL